MPNFTKLVCVGWLLVLVGWGMTGYSCFYHYSVQVIRAYLNQVSQLALQCDYCNPGT